jgi:DNA-binding NtrC family response regulator
MKEIQEVKNRFEIVGNSLLLNRALEIAIKVAPTDMNVLINGESGVGKENFSKIIHALSKRKHSPFIAINCGALPEGTIDSELFGHEKGSFTSAIETRKGYFETVDGGTIFLDEIGELPLETQSRLLRLLENGEFLKVGSSKVQKTNVRVVAATNKDLLEQTKSGKFREDLYYRLSTVTIKIPPLRERKEDIPFLWAKFAYEIADKYRMDPVELQPDGVAMVQNFPWPGNIRQLKHFVEQVSVLETKREIGARDVQKFLPAVPRTSSGLIYSGPNTTNDDNFNDKEFLYKLIFDLRREVSEIKSILLGNNLKPSYSPVNMNRNADGGLLLPQPNFNIPETPNKIVENDYSNYSNNTGSFIPSTEIEHTDDDDFYGEIIETYPNTSDNLSLTEQEKNMIIKALQKNSGKRKLAATDLGISERTLYRKLKEYNLED